MCIIFRLLCTLHSHMSLNYVHVCLFVCVCVCVFSHVRLFATPWTVAHQALPPMEFSRQEYWNVLPFPSPGDLPHPGIEPESLGSPSLAGRFFTTSPPGSPSVFTTKDVVSICRHTADPLNPFHPLPPPSLW